MLKGGFDIMNNMSRSQWYRNEICTFINSDKKETFLLLYSREIKDVAKRYPELKITSGSCTGTSDKRKVCRIAKK